MRLKEIQAISMTFALALTVALTGQAHAGSCGSSQRIEHIDAECLDAKWKNRGWLKKNTFEVENECPNYGKVVAKVDIKSGTDWTIHLTDGDKVKKWDYNEIREIHCCEDLSDLCKKSDIVTADSCLSRFMVSHASGTCTNPSASVKSHTYECEIAAECETSNQGGQPASITVSWPKTDDVRNCNGTLQTNSC